LAGLVQKLDNLPYRLGRTKRDNLISSVNRPMILKNISRR